MICGEKKAPRRVRTPAPQELAREGERETPELHPGGRNSVGNAQKKRWADLSTDLHALWPHLGDVFQTRIRGGSHVPEHSQHFPECNTTTGDR